MTDHNPSEGDIVERLFAETAILLTHPDADRQALAKDRIYAILFPAIASLTPTETRK